jgi:hypothetical protein
MPRLWTVAAFVGALSIAIAAPAAEQQIAPLPDRDTFLAETRKRLVGNEVLQNRYSYRERVTRLRFNPFGQMGTGPQDVYEVYPVAEGLTYRRLIERSGTPVPTPDLAAADREFIERYEDWKRDLAREGQDERAARLRREETDRARDRARASEAMRMFDFRLERREVLEGQPTIVIASSRNPTRGRAAGRRRSLRALQAWRTSTSTSSS